MCCINLYNFFFFWLGVVLGVSQGWYSGWVGLGHLPPEVQTHVCLFGVCVFSVVYKFCINFCVCVYKLCVKKKSYFCVW